MDMSVEVASSCRREWTEITFAFRRLEAGATFRESLVRAVFGWRP